MSICQYCGKDCGNEGAKTNHEEACDENPANRGEETTPARRQPREQARPPAQGHDGGGSAGGTLADAFIAATDDDLPAEARRDAIRGGLGIVGDFFVRYQDYRQQKMQQQKQRAENVELEPVEAYPSCRKCEYQFGPEDIGISDTEVRCPDCGELYEVRDATEAEEAEIKQ